MENYLYPSNVDNFEENRKIGEAHNYVCQLMRKDLIHEFSTYFNMNNLTMNYRIPKSLFETNQLFLNYRQFNLIECLSFFDSFKIVKFLMHKGFNVSGTVLMYSIHSNDAKLIRLIEENLNYELQYSSILH